MENKVANTTEKPADGKHTANWYLHPNLGTSPYGLFMQVHEVGTERLIAKIGYVFNGEANSLIELGTLVANAPQTATALAEAKAREERLVGLLERSRPLILKAASLLINNGASVLPTKLEELDSDIEQALAGTEVGLKPGDCPNCQGKDAFACPNCGKISGFKMNTYP